jgi:hypothetical protein
MKANHFSFNQQKRIIREIVKLEGVDKILSVPSVYSGLIFFVNSAIDVMSLLKIKEVCSNGNIPFEVVR